MKVVMAVAMMMFAMVANAEEATVNQNGGASSTGNAEGRGVANFTMSFSGSVTTKGNMDAEGSNQIMMDAEDKEAFDNYLRNNY